MRFLKRPAVRIVSPFRPLAVCWAIGLLGATTLVHAQLSDGAGPSSGSTGSSSGSAGASTPATGATGSSGLAGVVDAGSSRRPGTTRGARFVALAARVGVDAQWTDNGRLRSGGRTSDFITTVRPGIALAANGERLKADVDYSLAEIYYASDSSLNRRQNALRAQGRFEAVQGFAFVDFGSTISQQSISAFGQQSDNNSTFNPNRTEVATYLLSPYVQGRIGQWATYQARYTRQASRSKSALVADLDIESMTAMLSGANQRRGFSWSVDVARTSLENSFGDSRESDRVRAVLGYPVTPELQLALIPGWEANNYASLTRQKEGHATYGGRVNWAVSNRTNLSALVEKRFFGQAHQISFDHRTPLTAWHFSDVRDVATQENQLGRVSLGSLYDVLFNQFATLVPDPVQRAQVVQSFIVANNLNGNTNVNLGFLTSGVSLNRRQELAFTMLGRRETFTVLAVKSESSRLLQAPSGLSGDLANSFNVRQQGISLIYSRRLTPITTFNVLATQLKSAGDLASQTSELRSLNLSVSTRLGQHTSATLGARRSHFDNPTSPYSESAVTGSLTVQF